MKNIVFRADGNSKIGLGHIYRCLAIAERLRENFKFCFVVQNPPKELIGLISENGKIIPLKETTNYKGEATELLNILNREKADIVVLDGYNFDTVYQQTIRDGNFRLISIDDDQPFHYVSDVVINHADGLLEGRLSAEAYTKVYTGFDYSLLRKEFVLMEGEERYIDHIDSAFICFGGADPANITMKILQAAVYAGIKNIVVITGAAYCFKETMSEICRKNLNVQWYSNVKAPEMINIMRACELAIVPASTIALEAFTVKMFLLTGTTAPNQELILNGLKKHKTVFVGGDFNTLEQQVLERKIIKILHNTQRTLFPAVHKSSTNNLLTVFNSLL